MPSTLGSRNASLNEYPACYDKAKRALYRLLENVKLVKIPSLQETRGTESHPSEVPLQREIDSEAAERTAKKIALMKLSQRVHNVERTTCWPGVCIMSTSV